MDGLRRLNEVTYCNYFVSSYFINRSKMNKEGC